MNITEARSEWARLRGGDLTATSTELDELWEAIDPVDRNDIIGSWKGAEFSTGHPFEGNLPRLGWYGKIFDSVDSVHPIVCRDETGALFSNTAASGGEASLWNIEFRGESTATMVYDSKPIFDHFKRVDENTLLGLMNGKGAESEGGFYYYFFLERDADQTLVGN